MTKVGWVIALVVLASTALAQQPPPAEAAAGVARASSPNFALSWSVLDASGGGATASAGFRADLTLGQSPIGDSSGPEGAAELGFWVVTEAGELFTDGFESGDTSVWSTAVGGS